MKKTFRIITIMLIAMMAISCATNTDITEVDKQGRPIWVTQIPQSSSVVYGVGSAKFQQPSTSQTASEANARAALARKLQSKIDEVIVTYADDHNKDEGFYRITTQSVNLTMKGVKTEMMWTAEDGTVWTLVSFRRRDLKDMYRDSANNYLNQLEEEKLKIQKKQTELLESLTKKSEVKEGEEAAKAVSEELMKALEAEIKAQTGDLLAGLDSKLGNAEETLDIIMNNLRDED